MSLTKVIRFRHLMSQLTHEERVRFLSKLLDSHDHLHILLESLFRFMNLMSTNDVDSFTKSLSDIIQSRTEKPIAISSTNIQLHQFPRAIIGHTASFLEQREYVAFNLSNRSIYLGCNLPNQLQKLDLLHFNRYQSIDVTSFPSAKTLAIYPPIDFKATKRRPLEVTTLILDARKTIGWSHRFLNQNIVHCSGVTTLECVHFGSVEGTVCRMTRNVFLNLLTRFPNLRHLKLTGVSLTSDITANDIASLCPNLIGLYVNGGGRRLYNDLITLFARKLKHLAFIQHTSYHTFTFDRVSFGKLEELSIVNPDSASFDVVLKTASHLKKISLIDLDKRCGNFGSMFNTDIKKRITKMLVQCPIQSMYFLVKSSGVESIMKGIESGIGRVFKTRAQRQHRKEMRIRIHVHGTRQSSVYLQE
eukprot:166793_1